MLQKQLQPIEQEAVALPVASQSFKEHAKRQRRGIIWVVSSFVFCPCHLPLTLGVLAAILSGTAVGTFVLHYSLLAGAIITLLWATGTWYGFQQLRARQTCAIR